MPAFRPATVNRQPLRAQISAVMGILGRKIQDIGIATYTMPPIQRDPQPDPSRPPQHLQDRSERSHLRGILLLVAGVCTFPVSDSIAKLLTADLPIMQVVWGKLIFQTAAVTLIVLMRSPRAVIRSRHLPLQLGRSLLLLLGMVMFVSALSFMPLAEAVSILYVAPILVTALSVPLLGEHVGSHRWFAVGVGFVGAVIIIRPGLGVTHWASSLVLVAAFSSALFQIATRRLALRDQPLTTLLYTSLGGGVAASFLVPFWWSPLTATHWSLLAFAGALGGLSHFLIIKAFEHTPASVLAPFGYVEILGAALLGLLVFGDFPDQWTIVGAAVIAASGIYIMRRESRLGSGPAR